jgi:hypothetical protein
MHSTIGDPATRDKATNPLLRFDPYLDTVSWCLQTKKVSPGEWRDVCECYGGVPHVRRVPRKPIMIPSFQCPQPDLIEAMEYLAVKYEGNVSRFDIGCDVRPGSTDLGYIEQTVLIWEMILLRNRDKGEFGVWTNADGTIGTAWNPFTRSEKPPARDIVAYPEPCSKLPHRQAVGRFDYRSRYHACRNALRAQDIVPGGKSLTELDPSKVLRDNIRIVQCDMEHEQRRYFQHLAKGQAVEDARRLIEHEKRYGQLEYVQRLRDQYPNCKVVDDWGRVSFSHSLKWGAERRELQNHPNTGHMIKANDDNDL